jgi:hypothetical protein
MDSLQRGSMVLFYRQADLLTGLVREIQDKRCEVLLATGEILDLPPSRFVLVSRETLTPVSLSTLQDFEANVKKLVEDPNWQRSLETLSRLPESFTFEEACAKLRIADDPGRFALFSLLRTRGDLFRYKKGTYYIRSQEEREDYLGEQARSEERDAYLERIGAFLQDLEEGEEPELAEEMRRRFAQELRGILIHGGHRDLVALLRRFSGKKDQERHIRSLRLYLGDISPETDPAAAASGIPICFAENLQQQVLPAAMPGVSHVEAFSIDAGDTGDHDDAISLQLIPQGYRIGIHISDVASRLQMDSALHAEAHERVSSLYLPAQTIPLFPQELANGSFSLIAGKARLVLSLYATLDEDMRLRDWDFKLEGIRLSDNLSYEEVDSRLGENPFSQFMKICRSLQLERTGEKTERKPHYSWNIKVTDGRIRMQRVDNLSPARFIVEELMILYNCLLAEHATKYQLPLIYRNINEFEVGEEEEDAPPTGIQAYLSTRARYHPGIGSQAYLHATSPIRRFTDIVNQAQFEALLAGGEPPHTRDQLEDMIPHIQKRLLLLRQVARRSERYWLLRYIRQNHVGDPLDAILLRRHRQGCQAELTRWDKRLILRCEDSPPLNVPVKIVISSVDMDELVADADVIL